MIRLQGQNLSVLILVLMEYGLGPVPADLQRAHQRLVFILVLMEYGLEDESRIVGHFWNLLLNPCSNGIWSRTVG